MEIMRATARSGAIMTVTRAQEGTPAQSFAPGANVDLRLTKGVMDSFLQSAGGTLAGMVHANPPTGRQLAAGQWADVSGAVGGIAYFGSNVYVDRDSGQLRVAQSSTSGYRAIRLIASGDAGKQLQYAEFTGPVTAGAVVTPTWSDVLHSGVLDPAKVVQTEGEFTMGGSLVVTDKGGVKAKDANDDPDLWLYDEAGGTRARLRWSRSDNTIRLTRYAADGSALAGELVLEETLLGYVIGTEKRTVMHSGIRSSVADFFKKAEGRYLGTEVQEAAYEVDLPQTVGAITLDHNAGINWAGTLTGNATLNLIANAKQRTGTIRIVKGSFNFGFHSSWRFMNGVVPPLTGTFMINYKIDRDGNHYAVILNNWRTL